MSKLLPPLKPSTWTPALERLVARKVCRGPGKEIALSLTEMLIAGELTHDEFEGFLHMLKRLEIGRLTAEEIASTAEQIYPKAVT